MKRKSKGSFISVILIFNLIFSTFLPVISSSQFIVYAEDGGDPNNPTLPALPPVLDIEASANVGNLPYSFNVGSDGQANVSVPLNVAPGRMLTPELSLSYNSRGTSGIMGVGWGLSGISTISRSGSSLAQDGDIKPVQYNMEDHFTLDGNRLVLVEGSEGSDGAVYRVKAEDPGTKVVAHVGDVNKGPYGWTVYTKSGQILHFGNESESSSEQSIVIKRNKMGMKVAGSWALRRVEDRFGNYADYKYIWDANTLFDDRDGDGVDDLSPLDRESVEFHISEIRYTGNNGAGGGAILNPERRIVFEYVDKGEVYYGFETGNRVRSSKLLESIKSYAPDNEGLEKLVKEYRFCYRDVEGLVLLEEVIEKDGLGVEKPPIYFEWEYKNRGDIDFASEVLDLAEREVPGSVFYWMKEGDPGSSFNNFVSNISIPIDVNMDGLTDLLFPLADKWFVMRNTGGSFAAEENLNINIDEPRFLTNGGIAAQDAFGSMKPYKLGRILDYNNDGYPDIAVIDGERHWNFLINNGTGEYPYFDYVTTSVDLIPGLIDPDVPPDQFSERGFYRQRKGLDTFQVDVTGDGQEDLIYRRWVTPGAGFADYWLYGWYEYVRGSGWVDRGLFPFVSSGDINKASDTRVFIMDYNGDGIRDFLIQGSGGYYRAVTFVNGVLAEEPTTLKMYFEEFTGEVPSESSQNLVFVVDINGDGLDDLFVPDQRSSENRYGQRESGGSFVFINDGSGVFVREPAFVSDLDLDYVDFRALAFIDYDKDGRNDLLVPDLSYTVDHIGDPSRGEFRTGKWRILRSTGNLASQYIWPRPIEDIFLDSQAQFEDSGVVFDVTGTRPDLEYGTYDGTVTCWDSSGLDHEIPCDLMCTDEYGVEIACTESMEPCSGGGIFIEDMCRVCRDDEGAIVSCPPATTYTTGPGWVSSGNFSGDTEYNFLTNENNGMNAPMVFDIDGDRIDDFMTTDWFSGSLYEDAHYFVMHKSSGKTPRIVAIRDSKIGITPEHSDWGFTKSVSIEYKPVYDESVYTHEIPAGTVGVGTDMPLADRSYQARPVMDVVSAYELDNGFGKSAIRYENTYHDSRYDHDWGWLGFGLMTTVDKRNNSKVTVRYNNYFKTMTSSAYPRGYYPYLGSVMHSWSEVSDGDISYETVSDNQYLTRWDSMNRYYFSWVQENRSKSTRNGLVTLDVQITTAVDDYGNITSSHTYLDGNRGFDETVKTEDIQYLNNDAEWLIGLPQTIYTTSKTPLDGIVSRYTNIVRYRPHTNMAEEVLREGGDSALELRTVKEYDSYGHVVGGHSVDSAGNVKHAEDVTYDSEEQMFVVQTSNALAHTSHFDYYRGLGLVATVQDANGFMTQKSYDGFGRSKRVINLTTGNWSVVNYTTEANEYGHMQLKVSSENKASDGSNLSAPTSVLYDRLGRVVQRTTYGFDGEKRYTSNLYNNWGLLDESYALSKAEFGSIYTKYAYDNLMRPVSVTKWDGTTRSLSTTTAYNGLTVSTTDPKGHVSSKEYNKLGQMIRSTDADGKSMEYEYGAFGVARRIIDPNGNIINYQLDRLGRVQSKMEPDVGMTVFDVNAFGEIKQTTNNRGDVIKMKYDELGRLIEEEVMGKVTTYNYDASGMKGVLEWQSSSDGVRDDYFYNALGQLESVFTKIGTEEFKVRYEYDSAGRINVVHYPEGPIGSDGMPSNFSIENVYEPLFGNLDQIKDHETGVVYLDNQEVDDANRLKKFNTGDGVETELSFERLIGVPQVILANRGTDKILDLSYTYDQNGNTESRVDNVSHRAESFVYDNLDRVISSTQSEIGASGDFEVRNYVYDSLGNIINKSDYGAYYYEDLTKPHAVTKVEGLSGEMLYYGYDMLGNMSARPDGTFIDYNYFNKPKMMIRGATGDIITYEYAASKNRVVKETPQQRTVYIKGVYEKDTDKTTGLSKHRYYVRGIAEVIRSEMPASGYTEEVYYKHKDMLGSVSTMVEPVSGTVKNMDFDVFGESKGEAWTGAMTPVTSSGTRYGFTGHEHDDEVNVINMGGRIYDPKLGRFLNPDAVIQYPDYTQSYNAYSYVLNNPLSLTDPTGYMSSGKGFGGGIGVATETVVVFTDDEVVIGHPLPEGQVGVGAVSVGGGREDGAVESVTVPATTPRVLPRPPAGSAVDRGIVRASRRVGSFLWGQITRDANFLGGLARDWYEYMTHDQTISPEYVGMEDLPEDAGEEDQARWVDEYARRGNEVRSRMIVGTTSLVAAVGLGVAETAVARTVPESVSTYNSFARTWESSNVRTTTGSNANDWLQVRFHGGPRPTDAQVLATGEQLGGSEASITTQIMGEQEVHVLTVGDETSVRFPGGGAGYRSPGHSHPFGVVSPGQSDRITSILHCLRGGEGSPYIIGRGADGSVQTRNILTKIAEEGYRRGVMITR